MTEYVIEWSGTFDIFPIIDLDTGKVTHIPYNYKVTKGPTIKEKEQMTEITSKQWRFWHWILMRWPFLRGHIWLDNRRRDAFYKWKGQQRR